MYNINEVIRAVFVFFHNKISQAQNRLQQTKLKKHAQKTSKRKKVIYPLICVLRSYTFSAFSKNKEFKRFQKTSFYVTKTIHFFTSRTKLDFICIVLV